jgi:hypothetical protein
MIAPPSFPDENEPTAVKLPSTISLKPTVIETSPLLPDPASPPVPCPEDPDEIEMRQLSPDVAIPLLLDRLPHRADRCAAIACAQHQLFRDQLQTRAGLSMF